jgi:rhomboid family protein
MAAPAGEHAVPGDLRQQRRGPLQEDPVPAVLPVLRLRGGVRVAFANRTSVEPLVGASGAIAGVLGAYLVLYPRARVWSLLPFLFFIPVRIPAWLVLGSWFVLQWLYSAGYLAWGAGSVAYLAHVFGFLAGAVIGLLVRAGSGPPVYPVHPHYGQSRLAIPFWREGPEA